MQPNNKSISTEATTGVLICALALIGGACVRVDDALTYSDSRSKLLSAESTTFIGTPGSQIGESIDFVGDIDGDGMEDMVVVEREYRRPGDLHQRGAVHIIYGGTPSGIGQEVPITGHMIELLHARGPRSLSVAKAGDMNGDGLADFVIGDPYGASCQSQSASDDEKRFGRVYLVYGRAQRFEGVLQIGDVATAIRDSTPCTTTGFGLSGIGDIDRDGFADLAIGSDLNSDPLQYGTGRVHLFYGSAEDLSGTVALQDAQAVLVPGDQSARFGYAIAMAGDVNGDARGDFLVAQDSEVQGEDATAFLVNGSTERLTGEVSVATVASGFVGATGLSSTGVGDLDGDGLSDIAIDSDPLVHIFYGRTGGFAATQSLQDADAVLRPRGTETATRGIGAGDLDGDGHIDLVVGDGTLGGEPSIGSRGGAYVLYGSPYRVSGDIPLDEFGITYVGRIQSTSEVVGGDQHTYETGDWAGFSISVGDLDGDGLADFGAGAPNFHVGGPFAGRVYLVSGQVRSDLPL